MIRVGNIQRGDKGEYCGRTWRGIAGSPLANPYPMRGEKDRDSVCDQYDNWFYEAVMRGNEAVITELGRLEELARRGDLIILCHCSTEGEVRRCHCDTIKRYLEARILGHSL